MATMRNCNVYWQASRSFISHNAKHCQSILRWWAVCVALTSQYGKQCMHCVIWQSHIWHMQYDVACPGERAAASVPEHQSSHSTWNYSGPGRQEKLQCRQTLLARSREVDVAFASRLN